MFCTILSGFACRNYMYSPFARESGILFGGFGMPRAKKAVPSDSFFPIFSREAQSLSTGNRIFSWLIRLWYAACCFSPISA